MLLNTQLDARPGDAAHGSRCPDGVREIIDRRLARNARAPIAVAFSGGGDSLALLLAARAWARDAGRDVLALTIDHRLQAQSAAWTRSAAGVARTLGVDFRAIDWTGEKPSTGLPAAARRARHALLADAARDAGAQVILFGHTLDDDLEARLMRRDGSTLGALREWSPSPVWPEGRGVFLLRPLLALRRAALRERLAGSGLPWIEDPANDDPTWARARARREVRAADPADDDHEPRSARPAAAAALLTLARGAAVDDAGVIRISRDALRSADGEAPRRFIALASVCAGGGEQRPRRERAERLATRLSDGEVFTATLAGARLEAGEDQVLIFRDAGEVARGGLAPLALPPGGRAVWDGRFEVRAGTAEVAVLALKGRIARLPAAQRAALKAVPAPARAALPATALRGDDEGFICPGLTQDGKVLVRCLVGERLTAACGMIAREVQQNLRH